MTPTPGGGWLGGGGGEGRVGRRVGAGEGWEGETPPTLKYPKGDS